MRLRCQTVLSPVGDQKRSDSTSTVTKKFRHRAKQVSDLLCKNSSNVREELEELDFEWIYDDDSQEEIEEARARPQNLNQERLVAYFERQIDFNNDLLNLFLVEKRAEEPNYPLFRRYFKQGNEQLKRLLLQGLQNNPSDQGLLSDLSFFHEHHPIFGELIAAYRRGCEQEKNLKRFRKLVGDFYNNTCSYGYDVFQALQLEAELSSEKKEIVFRPFIQDRVNLGSSILPLASHSRFMITFRASE